MQRAVDEYDARNTYYLFLFAICATVSGRGYTITIETTWIALYFSCGHIMATKMCSGLVESLNVRELLENK